MVDQLLTWLSKSAGGYQIISHQVVGQRQNVLIITVSDQDQDSFFRLNNRSWAGAKIIIEVSHRAPQNQQISHQNQNHNTGPGQPRANDYFPVEVLNKLEAVIRACYEQSNKHLNLSNLATNPMIQQIPEIIGADPTKVWDAITHICNRRIWPAYNQRTDNVPSITLSGNSIESVVQINSFARVFQRTKNLDLSSNLLPDLAALEPWKTSFRHLEHLILTDNPINTQPNLLETLRQWYPTLKQLNNTSVDSYPALSANGPALAAPGNGIGQATFVPGPPQNNVPPVILNVAPNRPLHPEIPLDSYFAVATPDKPHEILRCEEMGLRLSLATKLTMASTEEVLKVNNWDYEKALQHVEMLKAQGQIPADRFLPV